jgi:hypothetical protein
VESMVFCGNNDVLLRHDVLWKGVIFCVKDCVMWKAWCSMERMVLCGKNDVPQK